VIARESGYAGWQHLTGEISKRLGKGLDWSVAQAHPDSDPPTAQYVLDVALAWSVVNRHFEVSDFLLEHGADINTNRGSHESASVRRGAVGELVEAAGVERERSAIVNCLMARAQ
jgi:hypothetical protein